MDEEQEEEAPVNVSFTLDNARALVDILHNTNTNTNDMNDTINNINNINDSKLFSLTLLKDIQQNGFIVQYLSAILNTCSYNDKNDSNSNASSKRRLICYKAAIHIIVNTNMNSNQLKELHHRLNSNISSLSDRQIELCIDKILTYQFNDNNNASYAIILELLTSFISRIRKEKRKNVFDIFCNMEWSNTMIVMLAAFLVDICESEDECERTLLKIVSYVSWNNKRNDNDNDGVDPEELPQLIYQITLIGKRCEGLSAHFKAAIIDNLAKAIDATVIPALKLVTHSDAQNKRVDSVIATIFYHLSLVITKDHSAANDVHAFIKNRIFKQDAADNNSFSIGKLLLSFLTARSSRQQDKIVQSLVDVVNEIFIVNKRMKSSFWFQPSCWESSSDLRENDLIKAFQGILKFPTLVEFIATPLIAFSAALLDKTFSAPANTTALTTQSLLFTPPGTYVDCPQKLGSWLFVNLFKSCEHTRVQITRELVNRLVNANAPTPTTKTFFEVSSYSAAFVPTTADYCVLILRELLYTCPGYLHEVGSELQEAFLYLQLMHPNTAGELVYTLSQFFPSSAILSDRCALALRKATFSQDGTCRQSAVSALVGLLRAHFKDRREYMLGLQHSGSDAPIVNKVCLSIDEIVSLLRRFMKHQGNVRCLLYDQIYYLQAEFPSVRQLAIQLLLAHLHSIVWDCTQEKRGLSSNVTIDLMLIDRNIRIDVDSCVDSNGPQEHTYSLLLTLLAMLKEHVSGENDDEVEFLCSQSSSSSQQASKKRARDLESTYIISDAYSTLWSIAHSAGNCTLEGYKIFDDDNTKSYETARALVLLDVCQAALVIVNNIPSEFEKFKISVKDRCELVELICNKIIKLEEYFINVKKMRSSKTKKGSGDKGKDNNKDKDEFSVKKEIKVKGLHIIKNELEFAVQCLSHCRRSTAAPMSQIPSQISSSLMARLDSGEQRKMKAYTLEKGVECLDKILLEFGRLDYSSSKNFNTNISNDDNYTADTDTNQSRLDALRYEKSRVENIRIKQLTALTIQCDYLLPLLCSEMIVITNASNDKDSPVAKGSIKWVTNSGLTSNQLVFRGILGCIKVQIAAAKAGLSVLSHNDDDNNDDDNNDNNDNNDNDNDNDRALSTYEVLAELLARAFHITDPESFPESNAPRGHDAVKGLMKVIKRFLHLALRLASDTKFNKSECPILMTIIGELISVLPNDDREDVIQLVLAKTNDPKYSLIASAELSQAFLTLLIMKSPSSQYSRLSALIDATKVISSCSDLLNDDEDDDASSNDVAKHVSYISVAHYWNAVTFVVGILEKIFTETEFLWSLKEKKRAKSRVVRKIKISDGHISDDEDNDDYNTMKYGSKNDLASDIVIYNTLKKLIEASTLLIKNNHNKGSVSERILSMFCKTYKLLTQMSRSLITFKVKKPCDQFLALLKSCCNELNPDVDKLLTTLHSNNNDEEPKKKKSKKDDNNNGNSNNGDKKTTRQAKVVPELIYQMEQLDLQIIKLSQYVVNKHDYSKLIRRTNSRDFQINTRIATSKKRKAHQGDDDDDDDDDNNNENDRNVGNER